MASTFVQRSRLIAYNNPLHIRCGDDILPRLQEAGLPGRFAKWCDPLCWGPLPANVTAEEWYRIRAEFLSSPLPQSIEETTRELREQDRLLETFRDHDAVILWFEHDLFDQAILMRLLDWFSSQDLGGVDLRLAGTDSFPGIERFIGLGQLRAADLVSLYENSVEIGPRELALGREAWAAWTASTPRDLLRLTKSDGLCLPYVQAAIRRQLEELPAPGSGLNRTERLTLRALGDKEISAGSLFAAVQDREEHPWRGDIMFFGELDRLAQGPAPLMGLSPEGPVRRDTKVRRTPLAVGVVNGQGDWIDRQGIDRWVAGTHLTSSNVWRWNGQQSELHGPG